jgi:hypothetical protein
MRMRIQHNEVRILEFEIKKTESHIGKLVPFHILDAIQNEQ